MGVKWGQLACRWEVDPWGCGVWPGLKLQCVLVFASGVNTEAVRMVDILQLYLES